MGDNVLRIRISPEHIFSLVPLAIDLTLHWPSEAPVYDKDFFFFLNRMCHHEITF